MRGDDFVNAELWHSFIHINTCDKKILFLVQFRQPYPNMSVQKLNLEIRQEWKRFNIFPFLFVFPIYEGFLKILPFYRIVMSACL